MATQPFDVIVTATTEAALACKRAMPLPNQKEQFVFASVGDPMLSGLIPTAGGNFTGGSNLQVDLVHARVTEMLKPAYGFQPPFAVVGDARTDPTRLAMTIAHSALSPHGLTRLISLTSLEKDVGRFVRDLKGQGIKSMYVCSDAFITSNSSELNREAHSGPPNQRIKTMFEFSQHVTDHGGTLSYGVSFIDLFENAADKVNQILNGTRAGDLPIYFPPPPSLVLAVKEENDSHE